MTTAAALAPAPDPDPDCPDCGGTGLADSRDQVVGDPCRRCNRQRPTPTDLVVLDYADGRHVILQLPLTTTLAQLRRHWTTHAHH